MTVRIALRSFSIWVDGQTYDCKGMLKRYGFRWQPTVKAWTRNYHGIPVLPALVADLEAAGFTVDIDAKLRNASTVDESRNAHETDEQERWKGRREAARQRRIYGE